MWQSSGSQEEPEAHAETPVHGGDRNVHGAGHGVNHGVGHDVGHDEPHDVGHDGRIEGDV